MDRSSRYLLMTGATGLIGSQVLARLLRRHAPVCVLVRATERQSARCRIEAVLETFESSWGQRLARPTILAGDLTKPNLGLSNPDYRTVTEHCSSVLHLAASLSFLPASRSATNEPYHTNVEGTRELLSLCTVAGIRRFHYVSTAYVCGSQEGTFHESDLEVGQAFSNDYEHSKVLAERLLRSSDALTSLTVYRPSIVIDTTGDSPSSQDRTLYAALSLYRTMSKKFGTITDGSWYELLGCTGRERKNLVEASWVADFISGVLQDESLHGQTYHLTSSHGTAIHEIESAFKQFSQADEIGSVEHDRSAAARAPHSPHVGSKLLAFSKKAISRGTRTIATTMAGPYLESFGPYFKNDPKFDRRHLTSALSKLNLADVDEVRADTIVRFAGLQESKARVARNALSSIPRPRDLTADCCSSEIDHAANLDQSWAGRLQIWHSQQDPVGSETPSTPQTHFGWGVWLTGPGGGDWRIDTEPFQVTAAGQECRRRAYLDVETWERLLDQESTLEQSLERRRLSVEFDDGEAGDDVAHQFTELLASLRRQHLSANREGLVI